LHFRDRFDRRSSEEKILNREWFCVSVRLLVHPICQANVSEAAGLKSYMAHSHASNLLLLMVSTLNSSPRLLPFTVTDVNRAWSKVP
jgi:hypothetical protein